MLEKKRKIEGLDELIVDNSMNMDGTILEVTSKKKSEAVKVVLVDDVPILDHNDDPQVLPKDSTGTILRESGNSALIRFDDPMDWLPNGVYAEYRIKMGWYTKIKDKK